MNETRIDDSVEAGSRTRSDIELEMLHRISKALTHQHDIASLLEEVLEIMESEMELSRGTLTLRRPDSDVFAIEASRGLTEAERKLGRYKMGEGITGQVAQSGNSSIVPECNNANTNLFNQIIKIVILSLFLTALFLKQAAYLFKPETQFPE